MGDLVSMEIKQLVLGAYQSAYLNNLYYFELMEKKICFSSSSTMIRTIDFSVKEFQNEINLFAVA